MRIGLYGKLPSKRDFIAISATRDFLLVWEAWLQGGISASAVKLGDAWRPAFLKAPIWRFWLGAAVCGETIMGAFMPSIDGVGRYFPLTVFVRATDGVMFPPPELEPQTNWFTAVEDLLLSALEDGVTVDALLANIEGLPLPIDRLPPFAKREAQPLTDGLVLLDATDQPFADVFMSARMANHAAAYTDSTFWWTAGGEDYPGMALSKRHMPNPFVFPCMLTGDFSVLTD